MLTWTKVRKRANKVSQKQRKFAKLLPVFLDTRALIMMRGCSTVIVASSKIDIDVIIILIPSIGILVVVYMLIWIIYVLLLFFDCAVICCILGL